MRTLRRTGFPLWQQIADPVAEEIRDCVYPPGDRLPTEMELAQRLGVNRHTVRRAVASLQDFGLLRIERKSTRVTVRMPDGYEMRHLRLARMTPVLAQCRSNMARRASPRAGCRS